MQTLNMLIIKNIFARLLCLTASVALLAGSGACASAQSTSSLTDLLGNLNSASASGGDAT